MPAWQGSTRAKRLPKDWPKRRRLVLQRDRYTCQVCHGTQCGNVNLEVDHIDRSKGDALSNLQTIGLRPCHIAKTSREAQAQRQPMRRQPEKHPGLR